MNILVQMGHETEYEVKWNLICNYREYIYISEFVSKKLNPDYLSSKIMLMMRAIEEHQNTGNTKILQDNHVALVPPQQNADISNLIGERKKRRDKDDKELGTE